LNEISGSCEFCVDGMNGSACSASLIASMMEQSFFFAVEI
jgi:succinate dehydrogenase/fumarate reductase-like Fe-S protein